MNLIDLLISLGFNHKSKISLFKTHLAFFFQFC